MNQQIVVYFVAFVISILASFLVPSKTGVRGHFVNALLSAAAGTALVTLFYLFMTMLNVQNHLQYQITQTPYAAVKRQLSESSERSPLIDARRRKLSSIEKDIEALAIGRISFKATDELIAEWLEGIRSTKQELLATNIVRATVWNQNAEMRGPAKEAQRDLIEKHSITIKRIWIYSKSDEASQKDLLSVSLEQKNFGVQTKYLTLEDLYSQQFSQKYLQTLGSLDVVLFDGASILVTLTNPSDYTITGGYMTAEPESLQAGRELFSRLWSISKDNFY